MHCSLISATHGSLGYKCLASLYKHCLASLECFISSCANPVLAMSLTYYNGNRDKRSLAHYHMVRLRTSLPTFRVSDTSIIDNPLN